MKNFVTIIETECKRRFVSINIRINTIFWIFYIFLCKIIRISCIFEQSNLPEMFKKLCLR